MATQKVVASKEVVEDKVEHEKNAFEVEVECLDMVRYLDIVECFNMTDCFIQNKIVQIMST